MTERLWIVEAKFNDGTWDICYFGLKKYASTRYFEAHKIKREQQKWLFKNGSKSWTLDRFRVREYKRKQ